MTWTLKHSGAIRWGVLLLSMVLLCPGARSEENLKGSLPILKTIGVIPVQVQHTMDFPLEWNKPIAFISESFSNVVRNTQRFRVLNDDVVADLWKNQAGRKDLATRFEMDAFVALTITPRDDVVRFVMRLIAPDLSENYLVEEDSISQVWLATAEDEVIENYLKDLTFRLINRIPIDVFVTSLQGPYITLSGGENQNIFPGDTITLFDTKITAVHPANGSWISYAQKRLGKARIIESKKLASVAEITSLSYEGAISLGSGAKIDALNSRIRFHRAAAQPEFRSNKASVLVTPQAPAGKTGSGTVADQPGTKVASATNLPVFPPQKSEPHGIASEADDAAQDGVDDQAPSSGPIDDTPAPDSVKTVVPSPDAAPQAATVAVNDAATLTKQQEEPSPSVAAPQSQQEEHSKAAGETPQNQTQSQTQTQTGSQTQTAVPPGTVGSWPRNEETAPQNGQQQQIDEKDDATATGGLTLLDPFLKKFDQHDATFSYHMFSVGAPATTSTKIPGWIFNDFTARGRVNYSSRTVADYLGCINLGTTTHGYITGLSAEGRYLFGEPLARGMPFGARMIRVGPALRAESIGISGEKYGGADLITLGLIGEVEGNVVLPEDREEDPSYWRLDAALVPLGSGSVGIKGSKQTLSSLGKLTLDSTLFFSKKKTNLFQWGASAGLSSGAVKAGAASLSISDIFIGISFR